MSTINWDRNGTMGRAGIVWVASVYDLRDAVEGVENGFRWELRDINTRRLPLKGCGTLKTLKGRRQLSGHGTSGWKQLAW